MANVAQTNPNKIPRPYVMVAALFRHRTGEKLTPEGVRQIELRAIKKLRSALEKIHVY